MKKFLLIYSLFISNSLNAQMTRDENLADFDYGVNMVETIYSGFDYKVNDNTKESYIVLKDSLRTAIGKEQTRFGDAFGCYLAWFKDYHLGDIYGDQRKYLTGPTDYAQFMDYAPMDVYGKVDNSCFLIRYSSCVWSKERKRWIEKAIKAFKKSSCENLILDLRGNKGGSTGASDAFVKLLFEHDGHYNGIVIRNKPIIFQFFRKNMKQDRYWQSHLDAAESSTEEYPVLFDPPIVHYENGNDTPKKTAVIIDNNTASCAEELVLILQRVSDRVKIFGKEHSLGCLDYANPGKVILPKSKYTFMIPLTCSLGLPESGIDETGIIPDVIVACDYPQTLTNNIDSWCRWVSSYMQDNW